MELSASPPNHTYLQWLNALTEKLSIDRRNNHLVKMEKGVLTVVEQIPNVHIAFQGIGNIVIINTENANRISQIKVRCKHNNNIIFIGSGIKIDHLEITIYGKDSVCYIGNNYFITDLTIKIIDSAHVFIADDLAAAKGANIWASDFHTIYDVNTREVLNMPTEVFIDNHVWLCYNSTILKNTYIAPNTVVAACSTVSGQFLDGNCILCGVPAKVIKRNINWDLTSPIEFR